MSANEVVCFFCKQNIVWSEFAGWLISTDEHRFGMHGTENCALRPRSEGGMEAGHCDEWSMTVRERFAQARSDADQ